jgi:Flp pilus assembly protein TadG
VTRGRDPSDQCGLTLILFVLMLTVLLVFVALALDSGLVFNERRQDQSAADAAALAATQVLLEGRTTSEAVEEIITSTYENTSSTNGVALEGSGGWRERWQNCTDTVPAGFTDNGDMRFGGTASGCIAFNGADPQAALTKVWVSLPRIKVRSTFGAVVGIDEYESSAEAIGEIVESSRSYALFARSTDCSNSALDLESVNVTGTAHGNDVVSVGPASRIDLISYVDRLDASPGVGATQQVSVQADPLAPMVTVDDYAPGGDKASTAMAADDYIFIPDDNGNRAVDNAVLQGLGVIASDDETLNDVLVFTPRRVELTGPLRGRATFVSTFDRSGQPAIEFRGGRFDLRPWSGDPDGLLALATRRSACGGQQAIRFQRVPGSDDDDDDPGQPLSGRWEGFVYAPSGPIAMEEGDQRKEFVGAVVGDSIDVNGSNYDFTSTLAAPGPRTVRLFR